MEIELLCFTRNVMTEIIPISGIASKRDFVSK